MSFGQFGTVAGVQPLKFFPFLLVSQVLPVPGPPNSVLEVNAGGIPAWLPSLQLDPNFSPLLHAAVGGL